jgi:hypothetical protein
MLTWPFSSRGARERTPAPTPHGLPSAEDFTVNEATIKVWLPVKLVDRLNWLSVQLDLSRQDVIRALIFRHLYGEAAYLKLVRDDRTRTSDAIVASARARAATASVPTIFPQPIDIDIDIDIDGDDGIKWSRARSPIHAATIGESTDNLRIKVPARMKEDLKRLAGLEGLTPSHSVRKLLVLALLGAIEHADWQKAVGRIGNDVFVLERDE